MEDEMIVSVFPLSISMQGDVHEGCSKAKSKKLSMLDWNDADFGIVDGRMKCQNETPDFAMVDVGVKWYGLGMINSKQSIADAKSETSAFRIFESRIADVKSEMSKGNVGLRNRWC